LKIRFAIATATRPNFYDVISRGTFIEEHFLHRRNDDSSLLRRDARVTCGRTLRASAEGKISLDAVFAMTTLLDAWRRCV